LNLKIDISCFEFHDNDIKLLNYGKCVFMQLWWLNHIYENELENKSNYIKA